MRITSKGQVTIPQDIRRRAGLHPHTDVRFVMENGRVFVEPAEGVAQRGARVVERLRQARPRTTLGTDEILRLARGE